MRYGMPYQGSKNKIARWIIENIPKKQNLYDLMGGAERSLIAPLNM